MTASVLNFGGIFASRSVFVTGHTGFKGSWLSIWLAELGAKVSGYSLGVPTSPSNFEASRVCELITNHFDGDIRDSHSLQRALDKADPEFVFHLAAQPLVRESYNTPYETISVNFMGTCALLETIRLRAKPCTVVVVTSDKCYENSDRPSLYCEGDAMGGHDPYSVSKGAAELLVSSYRRSFFEPKRVREHGIKLASARAGNVVGGGDWAHHRIVPDIVTHLHHERPVPVRNPEAVRPWQHVLEPLNGYMTLAARMHSSEESKYCAGWNFGPQDNCVECVRHVVEQFCSSWGDGSWEYTGNARQPYEAKLLRLSIDKATSQLGWQPVWSFEQTIERTVQWYRAYHDSDGMSMRSVCLEDIRDYSRDCEEGLSKPKISRIHTAKPAA